MLEHGALSPHALGKATRATITTNVFQPTTPGQYRAGRCCSDATCGVSSARVVFSPCPVDQKQHPFVAFRQL